MRKGPYPSSPTRHDHPSSDLENYKPGRAPTQREAHRSSRQYTRSHHADLLSSHRHIQIEAYPVRGHHGLGRVRKNSSFLNNPVTVTRGSVRKILETIKTDHENDDCDESPPRDAPWEGSGKNVASSLLLHPPRTFAHLNFDELWNHDYSLSRSPRGCPL